MESTNDNAADRLLEWVYVLSGGDFHRPVDLQVVGRKLGLSVRQMMSLLCDLIEQNYLLPVEKPDKTELYLTPKAIKRMASVQTRR